jgi:hypothetical protein
MLGNVLVAFALLDAVSSALGNGLGVRPWLKPEHLTFIIGWHHTKVVAVSLGR